MRVFKTKKPAIALVPLLPAKEIGRTMLKQYNQGNSIPDRFKSQALPQCRVFFIEEKLMKLLTKKILEKLPALYSQEDEDDPMIWCKFFNPMGSWTWYCIEYNPKDGMFFGLVDGFVKELGYFMLSELESIQHPLPIERDMYFEPCKLSEVYPEFFSNFNAVEEVKYEQS